MRFIKYLLLVPLNRSDKITDNNLGHFQPVCLIPHAFGVWIFGSPVTYRLAAAKSVSRTTRDSLMGQSQSSNGAPNHDSHGDAEGDLYKILGVEPDATADEYSHPVPHTYFGSQTDCFLSGSKGRIREKPSNYIRTKTMKMSNRQRPFSRKCSLPTKCFPTRKNGLGTIPIGTRYFSTSTRASQKSSLAAPK